MAKGGHRTGAGRKPKAVKAIEAIVCEQLFLKMGGEAAAWQDLVLRAKDSDMRLLFEIYRYWTDREYGRPKHRTEITGKDNGPVRIIFDSLA